MSRIKVALVPNTDAGFAEIERLKKNAKYMSKYGPVKYSVHTYGRMKHRAQAFAQVGRYYIVGGGGNYNSIYSMKSAEAKYCYGWAVYLQTEVKRGIQVVCNHVAKNPNDSYKYCKICGSYMPN